jgi:hypothetical protein
MSFNLAQALGGPALIYFRGSMFYSKSGITQEFTLDTFDIGTDAFGPQTDVRKQNQPIRLRFTPAGEWEALGVLFPYPATTLGDFITPVRTISAVDTSADTVTATNHKLTTGSAVRPTSTGSMIGGLTANDLYFVRAVTANSLSFHLTYAAAVAGTGKIDLTTAGSGVIRVVQNEPMYIYPVDGTPGVVFWNAAIFHQPDILGTSVGTLLGEVQIACFPKNGSSWRDSNSIYTEATSNPGDSTFDPTSIITQPYDLQWGTVAPFNLFQTKTGFRQTFAEQMTPYDTDADGIITYRLSGINVSLRATPIGVSDSDLRTFLKLQGTGAVRGATIQGDPMYITGNGVALVVYGAGLKGGPSQYSPSLDRLGELEWVGTRTFSAGVPNPLYYVGSASAT